MMPPNMPIMTKMKPLLKPKVAVASVALPPMPLVEAVCKPKVDQAV